MQFAALAVIVLSPSAVAQSFVREPLPRAPGARVSTITEPGPFTEPGIAVDPRDARHAVGVYQNQANTAWTADGGVTWTGAAEYRREDWSGGISPIASSALTGLARRPAVGWNQRSSPSTVANSAGRSSTRGALDPAGRHSSRSRKSSGA